MQVAAHAREGAESAVFPGFCRGRITQREWHRGCGSWEVRGWRVSFHPSLPTSRSGLPTRNFLGNDSPQRQGGLPDVRGGRDFLSAGYRMTTRRRSAWNPGAENRTK